MQPAAKNNCQELLVYGGWSMYPTLLEGDFLSLSEYKGDPVKLGDVVVFRSLEEPIFVVHRAIAVKNGKISTRGDSSHLIDEWELKPSEILGRVDSVIRKDKVIFIHNGTKGLFFSYCIRLIRKASFRFYLFMRPPYRLLAKSGILRRLNLLQNHIHVVTFKRASGAEQQLFWGSRFLGRRPSHSSEWQIKRPFRLFIDEKILAG